MSRLGSLKATASLSDLARLLHFKPSALAYILFKLPDTSKYKTFEIPKRSGGKRIIKAPIDALKLVQQNLSELLQDCIEEIDEARGKKDRVAHGFQRERSIITNAREHRNRRYVFNIDLEDFFPSINFGRVQGYFIRNRNFALSQKVAKTIAQIACHEKTLPQGSPSSPVISNLIAHILDMRLVHHASVIGCTYSRYADDLTFSTNKKTFPKEIAVPSGTDVHSWVPSADLEKIIIHSGFRINQAKTHMQYRSSRQEVTGLIVNKRINVRREYRHTVRAMVHSLLKTGSFELFAAPEISTATASIEKQVGTPNQLHGMLGFIDGIDLDDKKHSTVPRGPHLSSSEVMFQQFLIYRNFFAAEAPVVLCEGETDNVYLTHAIRSLATSYPDLASIMPDGKIRLNIRLYKYRKSSTARVLGLRDGGSSSLANFIVTYKKAITKFGAPGLKQPVIILHDNDSGAGKLRSVVYQACGKKLDGTEPFAHVIANLFVVPTPLLKGAGESKIEDFFEATLKATVVAGKIFDDKNDFETATHYGKKVFAYSVVRPNADSINFAGFHPLLTNLVAALKSHTPPP